MIGVSNKIDLPKKWLQALFISTLAGSMLLPYCHIHSNFPAIDVSDLGFAIIAIFGLVGYRNEIFKTVLENKKVFIFFSFFLLSVVLSIAVNNRWGEYRDWFEVIKYLKFLIIICLFLWLLTIKQFMNVIKIIFLAIFIFNVFHYFDWFNFNAQIEPFYAPGHHLKYFGLNSIGEPATKRALGVLGNPNNNGFLFLLFCFLFLPTKQDRFGWKTLLLPTMAIIGIMACQSRTIFIAYLVLMPMYFFFIQKEWKFIVYFSLFSILIYFMFTVNGNTYIESLGEISATHHSATGRLQQWLKILNEMPGFWFFGHGPDKQFFEQNGIFAESEFMLLLFRYGCLGLMSFFIWLLVIPFKKALNHFVLNRNLLLLVMLIVISGITNAPFHNVKLNVLIACIMALELLKQNQASGEN